jgi:hypothetical protein
LERKVRTDRFTEVELRYAGYTVYDQDYEKLAYRLQVTLAVPGLHPRPLARLDGGRHVRQIK